MPAAPLLAMTKLNQYEKNPSETRAAEEVIIEMRPLIFGLRLLSPSRCRV
jgi:hypothetical protein